MEKSGKICILDEAQALQGWQGGELVGHGYEVFATSNLYQFLNYARETSPHLLMINVETGASSLLDMIKETFKDNSKSENELIELFSNVDMVVIDDLGTEKISQWSLDKLYTIIENRNENKLPIIITTKFDKEGLLHRFKQSNDKKLSDAIIQKLYQMCYGIELKRYDENQKEKASTSDKLNANLI